MRQYDHMGNIPVEQMTAVQKCMRAESLLREARDLLKAAGASRTVDRVRLAITSAGGAVRHQRCVRTRKEMDAARG